jgi:selenide,water dikinase
MSEAKSPAGPRLTSLSHGGGCGCKISPGLLSELLKRAAPALAFPSLLVGNESSDDAAVYRLNETQAMVATTDFFMPIVDDPRDFGRIAAANALSDVYAMGGTPILALAIVGMPINVLAPEVIREILQGGESICAEAGIPVAGGHSIDSVEPIYGLVALGLVDPKNLKRNSTARAGDVLVLGKPIGIGIYSAALKKGKLSPQAYQTMIATTTLLNRAGAALGTLEAVHAMSDVTGFGLLGHLLEMSRGSELRAVLRMSQIPLIADVRSLIREGFVTGASARNWTSCGGAVALAAGIDKVDRDLLCDPQTSGGLLVACLSESAGEVIDTFRHHGCNDAAVIGEMTEAGTGVHVDT